MTDFDAVSRADEWQIGSLPISMYHRHGRTKLAVWLDNSCVRHAELCLENTGLDLRFTDCTHPAQNAFCSAGCVRAWRVLK